MTTDCMSWSDDFADLQSSMLTAIHKHNHDFDPTSTGSDHCRMWLDLPTLMQTTLARVAMDEIFENVEKSELKMMRRPAKLE
jgi:hypothetical protein